MNKYIEEYLEKRKAERLMEVQGKTMSMVQNLGIGEREIAPEEEKNDTSKYPYIDKNSGKPFRYNVGEVTFEDYEALIAEEGKPFYAPAERSGWYIFALIMIIVGGLAVLITLIAVAADDSSDKSWLSFWISLVSYLFVVGFFGIIMLLSQIKEVLDNMHNKMK